MRSPVQALSIRNLRKTYGNGVEALTGINLDVPEGEFLALLVRMGPVKPLPLAL